MTNKQGNSAIEFQVKVDDFLKKHSTDFSTISETWTSNGYDFILDNKVKTLWKRGITLKRKTSFKNKYDQMIYQRLFVGFYQYDNDKLCSSVLDSLLNCFGADCAKIKWGDNQKSFKTMPSFYLINEKEIIVCKTPCEHTNEYWKTFKHDLAMAFGNGASGIIEAECGGPVNFRKF